jgi:Putative  PD-(D/E)XK family member, (DUF4420)
LMEYWRGPANGLRDLMGEAADIEIKSTISTNHFPVHINSLEQLDDINFRKVYLLASRYSLQDSGISLPSLIEKIRMDISGDGRVEFDRKLLLAGYEDAHAAEYERKFTAVSERVFLMSESFPRLIRSRLPFVIRAVEYELDIDLIDIPTLEFSEIVFALGGQIRQ